MRIVLIGGTRFVGRALLDELVGAGHEVLVVHRGVHEPDGLPGVPHLHAHRRELGSHRAELERFAPDAVADMCAMTGEDARCVLAAVSRGVRLLVVSSIDVYRAFSSVWAGEATDPVPLHEESPVRRAPPPDRDYVTPGYDYRGEEYEKLDVERTYLERGATVCRLPLVYGEHDYKRREEFVLGRVRAGAARIPVGPGSWLWSRGYAPELARGMRMALESASAAGEVFNLCEATCAPIEVWMRQILAAAGSSAELVRVRPEELPEDLEITDAISQHWLADPSKARERLGWVHEPASVAVGRSVRWHLDNPPPEPLDLSADEAALAARA